jgi:PEP-CTERM motif
MPNGQIAKRVTLAGAALLLIGLACVPGRVAAQQVITDGNFSTGVTTTQALTSPATIGGVWNYTATSPQDGCVVGSNGSGACGFFSGFTPWADPTVQSAPYYAIQIESSGANSLLQNITLSANSTYTLTFNQAAANDGGASADPIAWTINLGGTGASFTGTCTGVSCTTASTNTLSTHGATTGWAAESFTIHTGGTVGSNTIAFLAGSTSPSGPPVALLDSISMTKNTVPEPASLVMVGLGFAGLMAARRRRGAATAAAA